MSSTDKLAGELYSLIKESDERKPQPYDTTAEVTRVEEGTVWVHIEGGVDETPVRKTIDAKKGDKVRIHVGNGSAWITGNESAPPTDDTTAVYASRVATSADSKAVQARSVADEASLYALIARDESIAAQNEAQNAKRAAKEAQDRADQVAIIANNAEQSAESARQSAINAEAQANIAEQNAAYANELANGALNGLAQVEDVVGTLNWLLEHSTLSTDTTANPDKKYYIKNDDDTFTLVEDVSEKNPVQEGWYELTEAVQNYILTHLALTDEGLWILGNDGSGKILLSTSGLSLYNSLSELVSSYGQTIKIGVTSSAYLEIVSNALLFFLDSKKRATFGYNEIFQQYGVEAENIFITGAGNALRLDNALNGSYQGQYILETRSNGHLSLKPGLRRTEE